MRIGLILGEVAQGFKRNLSMVVSVVLVTFISLTFFGAAILLQMVGQPALASGCVPAQISGHLHKRYGPERVELGIRYVSSSTAGATLGQPTVGPLNGVAEMTVPVELIVIRFPDCVTDVDPDPTISISPSSPLTERTTQAVRAS